MAKKIVHLFPVVHVAIEVNAKNNLDAIWMAENLFNSGAGGYIHDIGEYADEIGYEVLVDQDNDPEHKKSIWYCQLNSGKWKKNLFCKEKRK